MNTIRIPALIVAGLSLASAAMGQSAWLPPEGRFEVSPRYVYQSFETFWIRRNQEMTLPDDVVQHTGSISGEYGINEHFAVDATVGYTRVNTTAFTGSSTTDDGLADTRVGLRWRFLDERAHGDSWVPTLTLRAGGIIAGNYEAGLPFSAGDGAHGGEFSLLGAKAIGSTGFGLVSEVGYRVREHPVPDDFFASVGAYKTIGQFTLSVGYRHIQSLSGMNIMDPGFTFPELKEINQIFEAGLGFQDKGGRYYQVFGAFNVDGRNTGQKTIIGISATFPF